MKKWIPLLLAAFVLCPNMDTAAQGSRYQATALDSEGRTLKNTTVRVCDEPATGAPCTPLSDTFTDSALTNVKSNPFTTDGNGQFFFYVAPGLYHIQITAGSTIQTFPDVTLIPVTGAIAGAGTPDAILFVNSTGDVAEDPTQLCWDDATNRVGIGNCAPTVELDVTGAITSSGIVTVADLTWTGATATVIPFIGASGVFTEDPTGLCFDSASNLLGIGVCPPTVTLHIVGTAATLDSTGDADAVWKIDSGDTLEQDSIMEFCDRGTCDWRIGKEASSDFIIEGVSGGDDVLVAKVAGDTILSSTVAGSTIFLNDDAGNQMLAAVDVGTVGDVTISGATLTAGLTVDNVAEAALTVGFFAGATTDGFLAEWCVGHQSVCDWSGRSAATGKNWQFLDSASIAREFYLTAANGGGNTYRLGAPGAQHLWQDDGGNELARLGDGGAVGNLVVSGLFNGVGADDTVPIGNGTTLASDTLVDCNTIGDAVSYDTAANNFDCATHQIVWRAGVYETAPATSGFQDDIPLPVPEQCATNITVEKVTVTALTQGSGTMTFNVNRFTADGSAHGTPDLFTSPASYSNGGDVRQPFTPNNTGAAATDFFRINVATVDAQADVTFMVEGKCDAL